MLLIFATAQIDRWESNFCYNSHKLIIELVQGALWIWDAKRDCHGTSVNKLSLEKEVNWAKKAKEDPDSAQWTLASVFPVALTSAAAKKAANDY